MSLNTNYLGLSLKHPIIASASPLSSGLDGIFRLADAGAAAIVMSSIYEEQIIEEEARDAFLLEQGANAHQETSGYFPAMLASSPLDAKLETLRKAAHRAGVPIIASLNGCTRTGWVSYARKLEQAGAAAIELNLYRIPADITEAGIELENSYVQILQDIKAVVKIPVSVKISPFFSSPGNMLMKLSNAGADGLVLFNRFYEPDIDLSSMRPKDNLHLSNSYELRLPLMWTGLISRKVSSSLAGSTGVWTGADAAKFLLAGADAVMTTSSLLKHGPQHIKTIHDGLRHWMERHGFENLASFKGKLAASGTSENAAHFLRAQYRKILTSYEI